MARGQACGADCKSWAIPASAARWCASCPTIRFLPRITASTAKPSRRRLRELAYLNKGLKITFIDERAKEDQRETRLLLRGRYRRLMSNISTRDKTPLHDRAHPAGGQKGRCWSAPWPCSIPTLTPRSSCSAMSITFPPARAARTRWASRSALTKAFNDYARRIGALKEKDSEPGRRGLPRGTDRRADRDGQEPAV